jgi:hypothetical protein
LIVLFYFDDYGGGGVVVAEQFEISLLAGHEVHTVVDDRLSAPRRIQLY